MPRRILGALSGVALLAGAVAAQLAAPHPVTAANGTCNPHVSQVNPALARPGDTVSVAGSDLTCGGAVGSISVSVGGQAVSPVNLADTGFQFQAPDAAGSVSVSMGSCPLLWACHPSNTDHLFLIAPNAAQAVAKPGPGGSFTVSGSGFTLGGYMRTVTASACGVGLGVGAISDTAVQLTAPGGYCSGGVNLAVVGYATTTRNSTILTNVYGPFAAGGIQVAPSPGGLSTGAAAPGQTVGFSGAGFGNSGSATLNGAAVPSSWSDTGITLVVQPDSTSGAVVFTRGDGVRFGGGDLTVNAQIIGISNARAQGGDTVTLTGAGFGSGGSVSVGGADMPVKSWSPTAVAVTVPGSAGGSDVTVTPNGNAPTTAPGALTIIHLAALKPGDGAPGATIGVTGSGFGSQKGTVSIAGVNAPVAIWGDSTIAVQVPSIPKYAQSGGDDHLVVTVPGAPSTITAAFHVDPVPPPPPTAASTPGQTPGNTPGNTPGSTPGSTNNPTSGASPTNAPTFIPPSADGPIIQIGPVPFKRAPKVAGPVNLNLSSRSQSADPGSSVPFTVTLTAFGAPLVGAPVDLLLVVVPGGDASISPAKGVTDAQGRVSGVLHLSKRAGDHIILARSGQYSDEIKVTGLGLAGTGAAGGTGSDGGFGSIAGGGPQRTIIVAALLACLVLFLSGFGINIATSRNAAVAAPATRGRGFAGTVVAAPVNAGAAAQFGLAMAICGIGQLVAVLRRR